MKTNSFILFVICFCLICCNQIGENSYGLNRAVEEEKIINVKENILFKRFNTPENFERKSENEKSFAHYLQNLPLKPDGYKVHYYNGEVKDKMVYDAVIDMDIGKKDLQQCADAVMRLRAEFLYSQGRFDEISFNFTNGFKADYKEWRKGNRIFVKGNNVSWSKKANPDNSYESFREYLEVVFSYAGTLSLSRSLIKKELKNISAGDVFIKGGSPGHAVIVVDVAQNTKGEKVFMIAQSYMPAQEIQILKNFNKEEISPWYDTDFTVLKTPEWTFEATDLKTFE